MPSRAAAIVLSSSLMILICVVPQQAPWMIWGGMALFVGAGAFCGVRRYTLGALTAIAVYGVLFKLNIANAPLGLRLAGVLVVIAGLSPLVLRPLGRTTAFPVVHVFGLFVAVYAGFGSLLSRKPLQATLAAVVGFPQRTVALLCLALFLTLLVMGALLVRPNYKPLKDGRSSILIRRAIVVIVLSYAGSIAMNLLGIRSVLGSLATMVDLARVIGFLALWAAWLKGQLPRHVLLIAIVPVAAEAIIGIGTTKLYAGSATPIAAMALYIAMMRRVPWATLVAAAALFLMLNIVKLDFRSEAEFRNASTLSTGLAILTAPFDPGTVSINSVSASADRFAYSTSDNLAYVINTVPSRYPYWDKVTYRFLAFTTVPRAILPSKPRAAFGNEFGRKFGVLHPSDLNTSENLPVASEAYINFGYPGLAVIAVLLGLVLGTAGRLCRTDSTRGCLIGSIMTMQFLNGVESDSTIMLGILPVMLLCLLPLVRWIVPDSEHFRPRQPTSQSSISW